MKTIPITPSRQPRIEALAGSEPLPPTPRLSRLRWFRDWAVLAWALWWSWAYVLSALADRFPRFLGWTRHLW